MFPTLVNCCRLERRKKLHNGGNGEKLKVICFCGEIFTRGIWTHQIDFGTNNNKLQVKTHELKGSEYTGHDKERMASKKGIQWWSSSMRSLSVIMMVMAMMMAMMVVMMELVEVEAQFIKVDTETQQLVDQYGRQRIFHGVNVV